MSIDQRLGRGLSSILGDLAVGPTPDYIDDVLAVTAHRRQRPAWTFPERWLPMDITTQRVATPRLPWRAIGVLAVIALLLAATVAVLVGSAPRLPAPFGLAANGSIAYASSGDILVRDSLAATPDLLLGGPTDDHDPGYTPDGANVVFVRTIDRQDYLMAADAGGGNVRQLFDEPLRNPYLDVAPDHRTMALVNEVRGIPKLSLLTIDFFLVDADGSNLRALGVPAHKTSFSATWDDSGPAWALDGTEFAYNVVVPHEGAPGGHFRVHAYDVALGQDRALPAPDDERINEAWPLYSPDGRSILVHRWTWTAGPQPEGWLAVMPADGTAVARDIGPRVPGGENTGLIKVWSPDGSRILSRADNTGEVVSIDPKTGESEPLDWSALELPSWQRRAP